MFIKIVDAIDQFLFGKTVIVTTTQEKPTEGIRLVQHHRCLGLVTNPAPPKN